MENDSNKNPCQYIDLFQYKIGCEYKQKQYHYVLIEDEKTIFKHIHKDSPGLLNETSQVIRGMVKKMTGKVSMKVDDMELKINNDQLKDKIMQSMGWLDDLLIAYEENREEYEAELTAEEQKQQLKTLQKRSELFMEFLEENHITIYDFLQYATEWLTGNETENTITGFLCHISTYFKVKPVWFMALGKAGEGKSVIDEASLALMPRDAVLNGRVTEKALYRKSQKLGNNYIDGKILTMKDLGGKKDIENWADTIDRYKELTTEGYAVFEVVGEGIEEETGERNIIEFTVTGRPSVTLTSVNSESFDDQIMSRGVNVTPKATSEQVQKFIFYNEGILADERERIISEEISLLQDYIQYIHLNHSNVRVINPFKPSLFAWLEGSEYYKRALGLYPSLVEAITILNYPYREKHESNGHEYIVATKEDNEIIAELFNPSQGLSQSAINVFNRMLGWFDEFDPKELEDYQENVKNIKDCNTIFTAGMIRHKGTMIRSMKGLPYGDIISSLVEHGLIEPIDKEKRGNKNIYILNHFDPLTNKSIIFDYKKINEYIGTMKDVFGVEIVGDNSHIDGGATLSASHILKNDETEKHNTGLNSSDCNLKLPPWSDKVMDKVLQGGARCCSDAKSAVSDEILEETKENNNNSKESTIKNVWSNFQ